MSALDVLSSIYTNEGIHMRELSRKLGVGLPAVKNHINKLLGERIIIKKHEGRNLKFYLNNKNKFLTPYLYQVEYMRLKSLPKAVTDAVFDFLNELEMKPIVVIIFGSYAKSTFTRESDLDLMLVFSEAGIEAEKKARIIGERHGIRIEPVYLSWKAFKAKFFDEKDVLMKEIKENKMLIVGIEYWRLLENEKA